MIITKNSSRSKKEGLYCWKKCIATLTPYSEMVYNIWISGKTTSTDTTRIYYQAEATFNSDTGEFTLPSPSYIDVSYSNFSANFATLKGQHIRVENIGDVYLVPSTANLKLNSVGFQIGADSLLKRIPKVSTDTVIGYVVNDDGSKYPDDGKQDGYYYKKL